MSVEDVTAGWAAIEDAYPEYEQAESFYSGDVEEYFSSQRIADLVARTGQPYRFNFSQIPVNALLGRVEIRSIGVPDDEDGTERLKRIFEANDLDVLYPDTIQSAFVYGDSYLMVWPYDRDSDSETDDLPGAGDDELAEAGVEVMLWGPCDCRLIYDVDNDRRKSFFIRRWIHNPDASKEERQWWVDLMYPDRVEHWITQKGKDPEEDSSWEEREPAEPNTFGEIPVFHFRTEAPYGVPVHKNAYAPQLAINKLLITQLTTADSQGWPQRFGLTDDGAVLDHATDSPNWEADENADVSGSTPGNERRGGESSRVRAGAGTMQLWDGMKEVGQFDAADPRVFMDPVMRYISMMAVLTDTPLHDFERQVIPPSGESRRVAERPLVNRATKMQRRFRAPIQEMWKFALRIDGHPVRKVDVRWRPAYSAEDTHDWQVVQLKQASGVPVDQTLHEAGYDDEQVAVWLDSTTEAMPLNQRVDLVVKIADAAQKLGASVSASAGTPGISQDTADGIIKMLLGRAVEDNPQPA
jgi:hypothetical protein